MLDSRKGRILHAIINDYVETAEPIGSEWLVNRYDFGCKSATLRNEMAEMSELGYLVQPHTSAGRIPSHIGYRYYVDRLMSPATIAAARQEETLTRYEEEGVEVEDLVQFTCRLLAEMTHYPSVATSPSASTTTLHRLYITPATPHHVLIVLLLSSGHVEHNLLEVGRVPDVSALERMTNFLNARFVGHDLDVIGTANLVEVPAELAGEMPVLVAAHARIVRAARELASDRLFLEGTSHILRQREFQDVLRLEQLFAVLERRSVLNEVFQQSPADQTVAVFIGPESAVNGMEDFSMVTSRYRIREKMSGFIGVVGPTRMHYDRTVAAVEMMARSLSAVLTRASLG